MGSRASRRPRGRPAIADAEAVHSGDRSSSGNTCAKARNVSASSYIASRSRAAWALASSATRASSVRPSPASAYPVTRSSKGTCGATPPSLSVFALASPAVRSASSHAHRKRSASARRARFSISCPRSPTPRNRASARSNSVLASSKRLARAATLPRLLSARPVIMLDRDERKTRSALRNWASASSSRPRSERISARLFVAIAAPSASPTRVRSSRDCSYCLIACSHLPW